MYDIDFKSHQRPSTGKSGLDLLLVVLIKRYGRIGIKVFTCEMVIIRVCIGEVCHEPFEP